MIKMEAKNLKPSLRIKGFTGNWKICKLSELYEFSKGKGLPLDSFYDDKDSLGVAYGHLYTKYAEVINQVTLSSNDERGVLSQKGDILFPGSSTVPFGTAQSNAIMLDNVKLGGDVIIARAKSTKIYAPFMSYQINAQRKKLFPITVGTTITHMYGKDISAIEYKFPKFDEQVKIGKTLERLDSFIVLQQRKYEKLINIKKALLEKMFPKNGEAVPKLRFKGFTDTWEQHELDFLANKFDNLRVPVSAVDRVPGNTPYYGANGVQGYVEGCTHKGEFILVAEDGANDLKNYPVQYVNGEVWVNNHAHVLQGKVNFADTKFLGYAISQTNIEPFLVGGGRAKLNASTMMKIMILIPKNTSEQQRIGLLFENLDSLINLQQRKYEKLVNVKKALLQKMFI